MSKSNSDRWEQQWLVPSNSGGKEHKVSKDLDGNFFCDCWPFRKNRTCKHIEVVQSGGGTPLGSPAVPEPPLQFWEIDKVTPEISNGQIQFLKVPLVPFGNEHAHFTYTVFYDLMFNGVKWATIREGYHAIADSLTEADVRNAIRQRGRCVRGAWRPSPNGEGGDWGPYEITREGPPHPLNLQTYKIVSHDGDETLLCPGCGWKSSELYVITNSAESAAQHEDALCSDCFCGDVRDDWRKYADQFPHVRRAFERYRSGRASTDDCYLITRILKVQIAASGAKCNVSALGKCSPETIKHLIANMRQLGITPYLPKRKNK